MPAVDNLKVLAIASRTDSAGVAKTDYDQEELRMLAGMLFSQGYGPNALDATPNVNAFKVRQGTGSDMKVRVGNAALAKRDLYVVRGTVAGQGTYLIRNDATYVELTVPTTDASLPQKYSVFLFVNDAAYSGTAARAYAGLQVLRGTPSATPVEPSPDSAWSAYVRLWTFELPAAASAVTNTILDAGIDYRSPALLVPNGAPQCFTFSLEGELAVATGVLPFRAPFNMVIQNVRAAINTAPTGADVLLDINKNGTTIFTTQANRPKIAAGTTIEAAHATPDVTALQEGDKLTMDVDQIGSTVKGSNLVAVVYCLRTA